MGVIRLWWKYTKESYVGTNVLLQSQRNQSKEWSQKLHSIAVRTVIKIVFPEIDRFAVLTPNLYEERYFGRIVAC